MDYFRSNLILYISTLENLSHKPTTVLNNYDLAVLNGFQIMEKLSLQEPGWISWFTHLSPASVATFAITISLILTLSVHYLFLPWARKKPKR